MLIGILNAIIHITIIGLLCFPLLFILVGFLGDEYKKRRAIHDAKRT